MVSKGRKFDKNRIESGGFIALPHCVLRSLAFCKLSAHATKLLIDLVSQYKGSNNGDFSAPYSTMQNRGWKSKGTLQRAINELLELGFIEKSRQGGRHLCTLYAVTFYAVDECKGKLDIMPTSKPTGLWRRNEPISNIAQLQKEKSDRDDKKIMAFFMDKAKRVA